MPALARHQQILNFLAEQPALKVSDLATLLDVSEGTIRNDLRALEQMGRVSRTWGGAVLAEQQQFISPWFAERSRLNHEAKQWIARRAADMVHDGASILLDASTTVFHLVPYLRDCRNVTIVTDGIETGMALARQTDHRVIMLGGELNAERALVGGALGEKMLEYLHIQIAFVSAAGFSLEAGLTEEDVQAAELKRHMINSASQVVALLDSSKFGGVSLCPFATVQQVTHVVTDHRLSKRWIDQLQDLDVPFTVCDENSATAFTPGSDQNGHYRIGFANLSEQIPFAVDVRHGLERAANDAGNIDLVLADNQMDGEVALRVSDMLIEKELDLVIEYQIDEKVGDVIMEKYRRANIPVIAVDIPMLGATFFGVDNYGAGLMAGEALGRWLDENWEGHVEWLIVLEDPRAGALPASRIRGMLDGLHSVVKAIPEETTLRIDTGNTAVNNQAIVASALRKLPDARKIAVLAFADDVALGALAAARDLERTGDIVVIGQGADGPNREEMQRPETRLIGSTAYWPEAYGEKLINLAMQILQREPVPPAVYMDHVFVTPKNVGEHYPPNRLQALAYARSKVERGGEV
ncbi:MAG: substrate-binding domain-containing protein [Chloroflexi bacterium]|nr:substrate-binding domain-containing protein [Chloroflexota bacterium]